MSSTLLDNLLPVQRNSDRSRLAATIWAATLVFLVLSLFPSDSHAQTESLWLNPEGGEWIDAENWSTATFPLDINQDVTIDLKPGEPYNIAAREFVELHKLRLLSPDVTLWINDFFVIYDDVELDGSTIELTTESNFTTARGPKQITGTGLIRARDAFIDGLTGAFTFGEGIVLETNRGDVSITGRFFNNGTLLVHRGDRMQIASNVFVHQGMLDVAGTIDISIDDGNRLWQNDGEIILRQGSNFRLDADVTAEGLGNIVNEGAESAFISGSLINEDSVFDFGNSPIGDITFSGVKGGRLIAAPNGTELATRFGRSLKDVTLQGPFVQTGQTLYIDGDLTLDGSLSVVADANVSFRGANQLLGGTGELIAAGPGNPFQPIRVGGTGLVVGPDVTIRTSKEDVPRTVELNASRIEGTILVESDATFSIPGGHWTNAGQIIVSAGKLVVGTLDPERLGSIQVLDQGSVTATVNYDNAGKIIVQDQSTGPWTINGSISGGSIVAAGGVTPILGSVSLDNVRLIGGAEIQGQVTLRNGELQLTDTLTLRKNSTLRVEQPITGRGTIQLDPDGGTELGLQMPSLKLGEDIDIHVSGTDHNIGLDGTISGGLTLDPESSLEITGDAFQNGAETQIGTGAILDVRTNEFTNSGHVVLNDGALVAQAPWPTLPRPTFVNTAEGVIEGDGVIRSTDSVWDNHGTIGPGELLIQTDLAHHLGASLRFDIGGATSAEHDSILITGDLDLLGGEIEFSLVDNFLPSIEDEFTILYANSITGQFTEESIVLGEIPFDIIYGPDTISLRGSRAANALLVPEPSTHSLILLAIAMLAATRINQKDSRYGFRFS